MEEAENLCDRICLIRNGRIRKVPWIFRSPDVFIFNLCMPVAVLLLIGAIAGSKVSDENGMTYLQSAFASLTTVGICCSAFYEHSNRSC